MLVVLIGDMLILMRRNNIMVDKNKKEWDRTAQSFFHCFYSALKGLRAEG